jgi:hypothetical protein
MENSTTNNLVKTLTQDIPQNMSSFEPDVISGEPETSIFSNVSTWIIIILILAFLGFNVFVYLAKGTQSFTEFFAPYLKYFGITILDTGKQVVEVSAKGLTAAGNAIQKELNENSMNPSFNSAPVNTTNSDSSNLGRTASNKDSDEDVQVNPSKDKLMKALDNAAQTESYMADDASSSIQQNGKSRWCFIGEEKGVRNCVQLSESQKCMSGDIFPSSEICINPKLRR